MAGAANKANGWPLAAIASTLLSCHAKLGQWGACLWANNTRVFFGVWMAVSPLQALKSFTECNSGSLWLPNALEWAGSAVRSEVHIVAHVECEWGNESIGSHPRHVMRPHCKSNHHDLRGAPSAFSKWWHSHKVDRRTRLFSTRSQLNFT